MKVSYGQLAFTFFLTGSIFAGIKLIISELHNPALAAILAAIPVGLLTIYIIPKDQCLEYSYNYFYITLILLTCIMLFYIFFLYININKNWILLIVSIIYLALVAIKFFLINSKK
jgi:hypothetical protein